MLLEDAVMLAERHGIFDEEPQAPSITEQLESGALVDISIWTAFNTTFRRMVYLTRNVAIFLDTEEKRLDALRQLRTKFKLGGSSASAAINGKTIYGVKGWDNGSATLTIGFENDF
ncbi:MAG: hypothetical protein H8D34_28400 [Chloroflexi bacterium]|nr:hypothetical protein [Chloroflexota bacterium]